jgi:hypothetical protein
MGEGEGVLDGQEEGEREEREGQSVPRKRDLGDLAKVQYVRISAFRDGLSWKAGSESGSRARICKCLRWAGIDSKKSIPPAYVACAGILEQSMGARNRKGIGLSYGPAIDSWAP